MFNIDRIVPVKIKRLENCYQLPQYKTVGAAGMDLYAAEDALVKFGEVSMISTGIAIQLPDGYEAQIRARSGMAAKGIIVVNGPGTIDSDFSGTVKVLLSSVAKHFEYPHINYLGDAYDGDWAIEGHTIRRGDRIAQMLISPVYRAIFQEVDSLDETQRGSGGFGSTGV